MAHVIARVERRGLAALRGIAVFAVMLPAGCREKSLPAKPASDGPISTLPDLTLPDTRGGQFHLRSQPAQPLLLAFLQTVPDTADTPSRSQVVFLASMAQQYSPRGLRVAAVDASALALRSPPSRDAVSNASYDWQLRFPLLIDEDGHLARELGVDQAPTTFLISADGRILQRWRGFTRPAVLAQGIEELLGGPLAKRP